MSRKPIVLSLTNMHESGMGRLREACEVRMASSLEPSVLHREIVDADALVIRTGDASSTGCSEHSAESTTTL